MRRQKSACPGVRIAGAEEDRGRIMRWLSVLPWPPTGLADGFGRGLALPTPEPDSGVGLTPMQEMGPRLVSLSGERLGGIRPQLPEGNQTIDRMQETVGMLSILDNPEVRDSGGFLTPTGVPVKRRRVLGPGHPFFPRGGNDATGAQGSTRCSSNRWKRRDHCGRPGCRAGRRYRARR